MQKGQTFLTQGAVIVEDNNQLKGDLRNRESKRAIINSIYISINATQKMNVLKIKIEIQIRASGVNWKITGLHILQTRKSWKRAFTGIRKSRKLCSYRLIKKYKNCTRAQNKIIPIKYASVARMPYNI